MLARNKQSKASSRHNQKEYLLTKDVPFSVEEAYKSLRTNLIFSLPEDKCKIIEVTSSVQGEGKSTTATNLAISLRKNGSSVVLIDCDLRLPTIARKLRVNQKPGLTNLLFGMNSAQEVIQHHEVGVDVIAAGDLPPNPSEALGSARMNTVLDFLANNYDYVIIDAPPVGVVTDAAVLAKKASGVLLVARKGVSSFESVNGAIDTLKIANANILGFIMTDADVSAKYYESYGYNTANSKHKHNHNR